MNKLSIEITQHYPLFFPRLYSLIRFLILPIVELEKLIPRRGRILDIGCGYGQASLFLAICCPSRQLFATDINSRRITVATKLPHLPKNITFKQYNLFSPLQKFDVVLAVDLFHHLSGSDKIAFAHTARKVLLAGGSLIIKDINPDNILGNLINNLHDKLTTGFAKLEYWPAPKMINFFSLYGFKIVKQEKLKHLLYPHIVYVFN